MVLLLILKPNQEQFEMSVVCTSYQTSQCLYRVQGRFCALTQTAASRQQPAKCFCEISPAQAFHPLDIWTETQTGQG